VNKTIELPAISIEQTTNQDSFKNSGLPRILLNKSFLFKILACGAFFHKNRPDVNVIKFHIVSTDSIVVQMIRTPLPSNYNDKIRTKQ